MEIVRLFAVHLLIGAALAGAVAGWVVVRWAVQSLWHRARAPHWFSRPLKVAQPKMLRGLGRDLVLQSAD
jgi:hypothetical protein